MKPRYSQDERIPLTDTMIEDIVQYVRVGNYIGIACAAIGVHRATFTNWKNRGVKVANSLEVSEQDLDPDYYPEDILPANVEPYDWQCYKLFWALETAEAQAEATAVLIIRKQMPEQWTAAMTFLERRFPDRWRKRQTFETVAVEGTAIDEQAVIDDPRAVSLVHDVLEQIAQGKDPDTIIAQPSTAPPKLDQDRLLNPGKEKDPQG